MKQFFLIAMMVTMTTVAFGQKKDSTSKLQAASVKPIMGTPQQRFVIIGIAGDFDILKKAVNQPGALTRDEIMGLNQWIANKMAIPADSTQKKKN
jgi:hypothetical protein